MRHGSVEVAKCCLYEEAQTRMLRKISTSLIVTCNSTERSQKSHPRDIGTAAKILQRPVVT